MPDAIEFDLTKLSEGEKLWVWRQHMRLTQREAGVVFGIHEDVYALAERGIRPCQRINIALHKPTLPIVLRLCRKRYGKGSRHTASLAGYGSHVALLKAEIAGAQKLINFWEGLGFRGF